MLKDIAIQYFRAFESKNIAALRTLLEPAVTLTDWDIAVDGMEAVIEASSKLFNAVGTISVTPINVFVDGNTVIGELAIAIDGGAPIKVVDILEFSADRKIAAIRAFKG